MTVPAEWAPHRAMWVGWPSHPELWRTELDAARAEVGALVEALAGPGGERVLLLAAGEPALEDARARVGGITAVTIVGGAFGDVWLRDTGPIFTSRADAHGFAFNGWGEKYRLAGDETVARQMASRCAARLHVHDFVLEGGALDHDGAGMALTTRQCLLNANRNCWREEEAEAALRNSLGVERVIWLDQGLAGDHTDGHVDNLARFVAAGRVLCPIATGDDDPNDQVYEAAADIMEEAGVAVIRVPSPGRIVGDDARPLPASHMNFVVANGAVFVPTYGKPAANLALAALRPLFPGRTVIGLPSPALLTGGGSFHCLTQQVPA